MNSCTRIIAMAYKEVGLFEHTRNSIPEVRVQMSETVSWKCVTETGSINGDMFIALYTYVGDLKLKRYPRI
jgi:hypothetical protein